MKWPFAANVVICAVAAGCARSPAVSEGSSADAKDQGKTASAPRDGAALDSEISPPGNDGPSQNDGPLQNDGPSAEAEDSSEDVSSDDAGESEATAEDAPDAQTSDAADAAVDQANRGASDGAADAPRDASEDAARDAAACANGNRSLSNIGTQDFHISFRVTTKQTGWMALVSQRSQCYLGVFWDIRQCGAGAYCPVDGELFVETEGDPNSSSYRSVRSTGRINDGTPHDIEVARVSGALTIRIDGTLSGMGASPASLGTMPMLQIGTDACATGNPATAAFAAGTILSDLCVTSP
jgi:hypothetical protein